MAPIFLIAGAPAVGKSTTARAVAERFPKSMHIPVDNVRDLVISGLVLPGDWNERLIEQLRLARESVIHMARMYSRAGFAVVIDDFWDPNSKLAEYAPLFAEPEVHKILLYPSQHAAEERNRRRAAEDGSSEYIAGGIRLVYDSLQAEVASLVQQGWRVVDTTEKSVEETVGEVIRGIG